MTITIVSRGEPIRSSAITTLILGNPGLGKTSLANTAELPLLLAFDIKGARRSINRPDTVLIKTWADIEGLERDDLKPYKTITVDTIGRCLDVLAEDIMEREPKMSNGGQLSIGGFGRLKGRFRQWLGRINGMGISVVMIAHATEERHGDEVRLRVDGQGSSKEEVYKEADLMGRLVMREGRRLIDWDPSDTGFGKNPAGLPAGTVPNPAKDPKFLDNCIRTTADFLNRSSEQAMLEEERLRELRAHFEKLAADAKAAGRSGPEDFTKIARNMRDTETPNADRQILVSVASELGWKLDKSDLSFSDPSVDETVSGEQKEKPQEQDGAF